MRSPVVALAFLLVCVPALAAAPSRPLVQIGHLLLSGLVDGDFEYGCGFSAFASGKRGEKRVLVATWGEDENLHIFVNGTLRHLKAHGEYGGWAQKIGERETFEFGNSVFGATIEVTSTWVCPKGSDECELAKYRGTLKVMYGNNVGEVAINAEGGC